MQSVAQSWLVYRLTGSATLLGLVGFSSQIPVFLFAQLHEGTVHYAIDVPRDAPTMRGFAGLLHAGLHGATPAAIAATPDDLCQQLGLQQALGALRVRGLTALLMRMKRNAHDVAR